MSDEELAEALQEIEDTGRLRVEQLQHHKDGTPIHVDSLTIAMRDERGSTTGYLTINRDITERKRAEEALRESEERLKAALYAERMAWWDWDPATDQVTASDTMDDLFGLMPGETFQSSAQGFQLVHPDVVDRHRAMGERAGQVGEAGTASSASSDPVTGQSRGLRNGPPPSGTRRPAWCT